MAQQEGAGAGQFNRPWGGPPRLADSPESAVRGLVKVCGPPQFSRKEPYMPYLVESDYASCRRKMRNFDLIACSGTGLTSSIVRLGQRYPVSHVGFVFTVQPANILVCPDPDSKDEIRPSKPFGWPYDTNRWAVCMLDSTSINGRWGVDIRRMSDLLRSYQKGRVWWLPLHPSVRAKFDVKAALAYSLNLLDTRYDYWQAFRAGLRGIFGGRLPMSESLNHIYCSELVAGVLNWGGIIGDCNVSEKRPKDVCGFKVYGEAYYQVHGKRKELPGVGGYDGRFG